MRLRRGDVVLCQVPMTATKFTQTKVRPAIIVSKDLNNDTEKNREIINLDNAKGC